MAKKGLWLLVSRYCHHTCETYFWPGGIEDVVLALKVERPLRGQGKEKPTRGQQDRVGGGPLRVSSLGGMCVVLVLI